MAAVDSIPR